MLLEHARHDGSYGRTRVIFEADARPGEQVVHELKGRYNVLTHSPAAHAFVLGGLFETGVIMYMDVLLQVDTRDGSLRHSRYRLPLHLVSAVASDEGDHIALLGAPGWGADSSPRLWVYRPELDALYGPLGPPPAPPPTDFQCERPHVRRWLDVLGQDGYEPLEPGIIRFSAPARMRVSYGADTCRRRAERRRVRDWDLTQLTAAWVPKPEANQPDE
jgi:hypothetical protein